MIAKPAKAVPKRREARVLATLNVRVMGMDADGKTFHQPATTLDISLSGARIKGVTAKLNQGDVVGLQSGGAKSRFKVSWVKDDRDGSYEVGLDCLEKGGCPWHRGVQRLLEGERRSEERFPCTGSVSLRSESLAEPIVGTQRDVSERGCYVQCDDVLAAGEILSGEFVINGVALNGVAEVRHTLPTIGMGLQWRDLGSDGQEILNSILRTLPADRIDAESDREQAVAQVKTMHRVLATLLERLESDPGLVRAETIRQLNGAQGKLMAALKGLET